MIIRSFWKGCNTELAHLLSEKIKSFNDRIRDGFLFPYYHQLKLAEYRYVSWGDIVFDCRKYTGVKKKLNLSKDIEPINKIFEPIVKEALEIRALWVRLSQAYAWVKLNDHDPNKYFLGECQDDLPQEIRDIFNEYYRFKAFEVLQ